MKEDGYESGDSGYHSGNEQSGDEQSDIEEELEEEQFFDALTGLDTEKGVPFKQPIISIKDVFAIKDEDGELLTREGCIVNYMANVNALLATGAIDARQAKELLEQSVDLLTKHHDSYEYDGKSYEIKELYPTLEKFFIDHGIQENQIRGDYDLRDHVERLMVNENKTAAEEKQLISFTMYREIGLEDIKKISERKPAKEALQSATNELMEFHQSSHSVEQSEKNLDEILEKLELPGEERLQRSLISKVAERANALYKLAELSVNQMRSQAHNNQSPKKSNKYDKILNNAVQTGQQTYQALTGNHIKSLNQKPKNTKVNRYK